MESFTLSGELLAGLVGVCALLAFTPSLGEERLGWVALAGLLCGSAVMVKQSGLDAGFALAAWVLVARRWRSFAVLVGAAAVPVVVAVLAAPSASAWWDAVVAYRGQGDSLLTGSVGGRASQFWDTAPALAVALGPLALLAALGFRRAPLLFRLWLGGALVGVVGGGTFHAHYYIQLGPPLAVLGAYGVARLGRPALVAVAAVAVATTGAFALASRTTQTRLLWPHDTHLRYDEEAAALIRGKVPPGTPIAVAWGAADLYFLADRPPALRYLWYRNAQTIPGASSGDIATIRRGVPLVVALSPALGAYPELREALRSGYRPVRTLGPLHVYERK